MQTEERTAKWMNLAIGIAAVILGIVFWERLKPLFTLVITLGILVFIHELGHFLAARWAKVRVTEFALGFGPKLWTYMRRGGTDFTVRAVPLGGFVNMPGMMPDEADIEDGLASKPALQRAVVFAAGPAMNLVLAFVVLCLMGFVIGSPDGKEVFVGAVTPKSPAERMGLKVGDRILSVRGQTITSSRQLARIVNDGPEVDTEVVVQRAGQVVRFHGVPENNVDKATGRSFRAFGIHQISSVGDRLPLGESIREGTDAFVGHFVVLGKLVQSGRLAQSVGGPLMMYQETRSRGNLPTARLLYQVDLLCALSISLAVFNLLPVPVLDGGHLFLLGIEVLRRRRLTPDTVRIAHMIGLAVIGVLFVLIMYKDLTRMIG